MNQQLWYVVFFNVSEHPLLGTVLIENKTMQKVLSCSMRVKKLNHIVEKNIRLKDFMKEYLHCKENANKVTYVLLFAYTAYTVSKGFLIRIPDWKLELMFNFYVITDST